MCPFPDEKQFKEKWEKVEKIRKVPGKLYNMLYSYPSDIDHALVRKSSILALYVRACRCLMSYNTCYGEKAIKWLQKEIADEMIRAGLLSLGGELKEIIQNGALKSKSFDVYCWEYVKTGGSRNSSAVEAAFEKDMAAAKSLWRKAGIEFVAKNLNSPRELSGETFQESDWLKVKEERTGPLANPEGRLLPGWASTLKEPSLEPKAIHVCYVDNVGGETVGRTWPPGRSGGTNFSETLTFGFILMNRSGQRSAATLAHEIGHVFLGAGHTLMTNQKTSNNLMKSGPLADASELVLNEGQIYFARQFAF